MIEQRHKLILGIHGVMPETLPAVRALVDRLERHGRAPATLLVVPGREWRPGELAELRRWRDQGHELGGQGWSCRAPAGRWPWPRSRAPAEHLACDADGVVRLIRRCRSWFDEHDLGAPRLYVPPRWEMGRVRRLDIRSAGFRYFEYPQGFYDARIGVFQRVPRLGFDAVTAWGALLRRGLNRQALEASRRYGWLRVVVRPQDLNGRLGEALAALTDGPGGRAASVAELFESGPPEALAPPRLQRAGRRVRTGQASSVG